MPIEIERKYLVNPNILLALPEQLDYRKGIDQLEQYYLFNLGVEVRIRNQNNYCYITTKIGSGERRYEFEQEINAREYEELKKIAISVIRKTRYFFRNAGSVWELDVYHGKQKGMVTVEVEYEDGQSVPLPPTWMREYILRDVTDDKSYKNANLATPISRDTGPTLPTEAIV
jgi:adenylate cyclase